MGRNLPNNDSRPMQPLPWAREPREPGKCVSLSSPNGKAICSFWGGNTRDSQNMAWCTEAQMEAHAAYAEHACSAFPMMQAVLESVYNMEDMPEEAIKAIESLMEQTYYSEVPPYAGR